MKEERDFQTLKVKNIKEIMNAFVCFISFCPQKWVVLYFNCLFCLINIFGRLFTLSCEKYFLKNKVVDFKSL